MTADRHGANPALRESEEQYRLLVELSPDGMLIHEDERITFANDSAAQIMGAARPDDLLGRSLFDLVHPDSHNVVRTRLKEARTMGALPISEQCWHGVDGSPRTVEVVSRAVTYNDHALVLTIFRDVTARKRLESQLALVQRLDALGRLAGGIAHDFNNLLGVMMSYTGVLIEETSSDDPKAADLREIERAIERAASLTGQLLAFGRKGQQRRERIDIAGAIRTSERLIRRLIGEDIAVAVTLPETPLVANIDAGQFEQVMLNLAINARDAMPRGGALNIRLAMVTLTDEEAAAQEARAGDFARVTVSDTGKGMDEQTMARMFDPFFTTKEVGRGPGLGLATIYGIMRQSEGFVTVESAVDKGASFHLYFPLADSARPARVERPTAGTTASLLLVEDEDALRRITERVLGSHGFHVVAAPSPEDALALLRDPSAHFDCLVTDVVMPGMSGQELAARVRAMRGPIPVLLLSGYARDAVESRGDVADDMPLLHKPFKAADLVAAIADLLARHAT